MSRRNDSLLDPAVAECHAERRVPHARSPTQFGRMLVDGLFILHVVLWGNWSLYYWIAVLGFGASFRSLTFGLPILLAQVVVSAWLVRHWALPAQDRSRLPRPAARISPGIAAGHACRWVIGSAIVLAGIACAVWATGLSRSAVGYNILWAIAMPPFLAACAASPRGLEEDAAAADITGVTPPWAGLDLVILALVIAVGAWAANFFGFPSPDDAFYAHVMSSTLAHQDLPVQSQDLLLGTSAPYSIHPGYRASGFEVLAALIADVTRCDPLWVYYDLYPQLGVLFWVLAAHVFFRSLGLPLPAMAVAVSMAMLLFWLAGKSPGVWFVNLHFGKGFLACIGASLIFGTVAAFARRRDCATWLLVLLSVCAVLGWTSSAMFVTPASLALAAAIYLPWSKSSSRTAALIAVTLVPAVGLIVATSRMAATAPPTLSSSTGEILVNGESLGGIWVQALLFLTLLALPLAARARGRASHVRLFRRLALVGGVSVFAPYWIEAFAMLSGMSLLSWRMSWAFPSGLLGGVLSSLLLAAPYASGSTPSAARSTLLWTVPMFGVWIVVWLHSFIPPWPLCDTFSARAQISRNVETLVQDAREIRAMLPAEGLVASGYVNEILPILPNPPRFVAVRFYLSYHGETLSEDEFRMRTVLDRTLVELKPTAGRSVDETVAEAMQSVRRLGVTGVVFAATPAAAKAARWPYGEHKEPVGSVELIDALTRGLCDAGFQCRDISSGKARVCLLPAVPKPRTGDKQHPLCKSGFSGVDHLASMVR